MQHLRVAQFIIEIVHYNFCAFVRLYKLINHVPLVKFRWKCVGNIIYNSPHIYIQILYCFFFFLNTTIQGAEGWKTTRWHKNTTFIPQQFRSPIIKHRQITSPPLQANASCSSLFSFHTVFLTYDESDSCTIWSHSN